MKYRIKLSSRRKATGEHTFKVHSPVGVLSVIQWNSRTGYFEYYSPTRNPISYYGVYYKNWN